MRPVLAALSPRSVLVQRRATALARELDAPLELVPAGSAWCGLARGRIVARARELDARLVVVGGGAHGLQRRLEVPVLVARTASDLPYRRIVLGSDLVAQDAATLAGLRRDHPRAALHLVHIYQWHVLRPLRHTLVSDEALECCRALAASDAARAVRRFAREQAVSRDVALHAVLGPVARTLRRYASALGADLLVLSPERSAVKALIGASVTQALLADPPCDVLLVPGPRAAPAPGPADIRSAPRRTPA
jgi:nucleotide-binding universal stress UspA family protein